jgi:hypothetical protein
VIEQYDFLVTGVIAATVWGGIFFKLPGLAAVAAAITVYGLGIIYPADWSLDLLIGFGFVFGFGYGAIPTFYTENFPTRYRASGASAAYQIAQVYGGGLIPIVAGQILSAYGVKDAYPYIGGYVMLYAIAAIIAILRTPETKSVSLEA